MYLCHHLIQINVIRKVNKKESQKIDNTCKNKNIKRCKIKIAKIQKIKKLKTKQRIFIMYFIKTRLTYLLIQ